MKKYFAVIDTNVLVSSFLKRDSIPNKIIRYCLEGPIVPLLNYEIFNEYVDVLTRKKFNFDVNEVREVLMHFSNRAVFLDRTISEEYFADTNDIVFYEIALTARKATDAFLITGNIKHFPIKSFIVTPKEMLDIIRKDKE